MKYVINDYVNDDCMEIKEVRVLKSYVLFSTFMNIIKFIICKELQAFKQYKICSFMHTEFSL